MPEVKLRHDPNCPDQSSISERRTRRGYTIRTCEACGRWAVDLEDQANSIEHHDDCYDRDRLRVNLKEDQLFCISCGRFVVLGLRRREVIEATARIARAPRRGAKHQQAAAK